MQTIERADLTPSPEPPKRRTDALWIGLGILAIPLVALIVMSRLGVAAAVFVAFLAGVGVFVRRKQVMFFEVVAFCIHFDGIGLGPIRAGRILAAVALGVILWKLVAERWRPPAVPVLFWAPPMMLLIVAVGSGAWGGEPGPWLFAMGLLGLAFAMWSVAALLVDDHSKVMRYLRAFWIGGFVAGANGIFSVFIGGRSEGFGGDPNFFGLLQASLIPLTIYYRRHARTSKEKWLYSVALVYIFVAAAGAGSRSGAIGASLALVATMVLRPGLSPLRRVRTGVTALLAGGLLFFLLFFVNPVNAARGFSDRGAGRVDFWNVTIGIIRDNPLSGVGFGQSRGLIPERLASTPGVLELIETRSEVSSHNTLLDITADLGIIGLFVWIAVFGVTLYGFFRPRWPQYREVSVIMAAMMVPVFSGMFLLPLLNNKLAWSLVGLSAALQVPSRQARWRGYFAAGLKGRIRDVPDSLNRGGGERRRTTGGRVRQVDPNDPSSWTTPALARFDLRISQRYRRLILAGAVVGAVVSATVAGGLPARYEASAAIVLPGLEDSPGTKRINVSADEAQGMQTIVQSGAYAQALRRLAGLDLSIEQVADRVGVRRPSFSVYLELTFTDSDLALSEQVLPYLIPALDEVVADARRSSVGQVADEFRPIEPGQQRYYTGPLYVPVSDQATVAVVPRPVAWIVFFGMVTGMLVAAALVVLQQQRPRINNDDDLDAEVGVGVWAHVARLGRRFGATPAQFAQVVAAAQDRTPVRIGHGVAPVEGGPPQNPGDERPAIRRFVVTTPTPDRAARGLAAGVAAACAAQGQRVVLVDAQIDSPRLSMRLAPGRRRGLVQVSSGSASISQVMTRIRRFALPSAVRRTLGRASGNVRFIPAGTVRARTDVLVSPAMLEELGPDVVAVVLAPSLLSRAPVSQWLGWADATLLTLVEGRTVTFDAEDAAGELRSLAAPPYGIVMLDV